MKRILLAVMLVATSTFMIPITSWSSTYYLYNQWGGTWHDANKTYVDDSLMCWAASAANILDWGNWDAAGYNSETKIFEEIKAHWTNNAGYQNWAWQWWLNGTPPPYNSYSHIEISGGGNYYPNEDFYNYYRTASRAGEIGTMAGLMSKGYGISLVIFSSTGSTHAITAWGYDYDLIDNTESYTALYITDSDDKVSALRRMGIAYNTTKGWYFTSGYTNWKINGVYALGRNTVAPVGPSWWFFMSGAALLGAAGLRRNRSS